jgi:excisionase family DNA binding protein
MLLDPLSLLDGPLRNPRACPPRPPGAPLTLKEAAGWLRLHPDTLWRWIQDGRINASKTSGRWLIPESEVLRFTRT